MYHMHTLGASICMQVIHSVGFAIAVGFGWFWVYLILVQLDTSTMTECYTGTVHQEIKC